MVSFEGVGFFGHLPVDDAEVPFVQFPVLDLLVEHPQGGGIFGRDDNPAGVAVNPVAEGWGKAVFL